MCVSSVAWKRALVGHLEQRYAQSIHCGEALHRRRYARHLQMGRVVGPGACDPRGFDASDGRADERSACPGISATAPGRYGPRREPLRGVAVRSSARLRRAVPAPTGRTGQRSASHPGDPRPPRPIRYLRDGFFYGREFVSDEDLNEQALDWLETVANVRVHGALGEVPLVRFERERLLLGPLAARPHPGVLPVPSEPVEDVLPRVVVERQSLAEYGRLGEMRR